MQVKPEIAFHGLESSDAVVERIHEKIADLEKHYDRLTSCRVVIDVPNRTGQGHKPATYQVKIVLGIPGGRDVAVTHDEGDHDVYAALKSAFGAARRRLQDLHDKRVGKVKSHQS